MDDDLDRSCGTTAAASSSPSPPLHHHISSSSPSSSPSSTTPPSPSTPPSLSSSSPPPPHSLQLRPGGPHDTFVDFARLRSLLLVDNPDAAQGLPHSLLAEALHIPSGAVDGTIVYGLDGLSDLDSKLAPSLSSSISPSSSLSPQSLPSPTKASFGRTHNLKFPLETVTETPAWEEQEQRQHQQKGARKQAMSVEVLAAPGSPPHLASSMSSNKSPSLHSSSTPQHADDLNDASHFEEISLSDNLKADDPPRPSTPASHDVKPRPLLRANTTPPKPYHSKSHGNLRDVANSGLKTTAQRSIYSKSRSPKDPWYPRNSWNKSVPSLNSGLSPTGANGRRTPSPTKPQSGQISPLRSPVRPGAGPRPKSDSAPPLPLQRRTTWQPQRRKSSKELEDEYDDLDEEVPEDAIIWNVPLSPRPPPSHSRSQSESPERQPERGPPSPESGSLQAVRDFRASRTKSWDAAMKDLSKEARALTSKLEDYAGNTTDDRTPLEEVVVNGSPSPPRPAMNARAKTVELPPLQKINPMIDPLPASKEKEKHLTRTRPSWLPPKSPKEERKHLREYQRMMSDFLLAESKRSAQKENERRSKGKEEDTLAKQWINSIIPNWDTAIHKQSSRELWWRGIPTSIRGMVWSRAIGNDLHLSSRSYEAALKRAKAAPAVEDGEDAKTRSRRRSLSLMQTDVAACFPSVRLFQSTQPKHEELMDVLSAYASYRSDTGYVRGTASIAALLLLYVTSPADTFIALANLLNRPLSLALCLADETSTQRVYRSVVRVFSHKMPKLHAHILATCAHSSSDVKEAQNGDTVTGVNDKNVQVGGPPLTYADWFEASCTSLLTTFLNADACARIWDVMLFEGDGALVRGLVGSLSRIENRLYGDTSDVNLLLGYGRGEVDAGSPEEVAQAARWAGRHVEPAPQT